MLHDGTTGKKKKKMHTTDVFAQKESQHIKNKSSVHVSSCVKQEVMYKVVVAAWGQGCSDVTIRLQIHCLFVSMLPPTSLLKTLTATAD